MLNNVEVGNFCSIGPYVQIGLGPHPSKTFVSTYPAFYSDHTDGCPLAFRENKIFDDSIPKTFLGNDVWIGANAIIPGGINIGTGAIVAAGAVVVKDVPPYAIVGGNPAKVIRYRFSEDEIQFLLKSEWWNWPIEKIRRHVNDFSDIERFVGRMLPNQSKNVRK
jgi:acetyltransferase-like isoleucine patch superfamily enzyme